MIPYTCPGCGRSFQVPDEQLGKVAKCKCGSKNIVAWPERPAVTLPDARPMPMAVIEQPRRRGGPGLPLLTFLLGSACGVGGTYLAMEGRVKEMLVVAPKEEAKVEEKAAPPAPEKIMPTMEEVDRINRRITALQNRDEFLKRMTAFLATVDDSYDAVAKNCSLDELDAKISDVRLSYDKIGVPPDDACKLASNGCDRFIEYENYRILIRILDEHKNDAPELVRKTREELRGLARSSRDQVLKTKISANEARAELAKLIESERRKLDGKTKA